jgi:hypothetical protein
MPPLDAFRLIRQIAVLDGSTEPARVIASAKVKHPGFLVDPVRNLRENRKILRFEIVTVSRSAEIETAVAQIALGVLPVVANAFGASGYDIDREWSLLRSSEPDDGLPLLMC